MLKVQFRYRFLLGFLVTLFYSLQSQSQIVGVEITGIRSEKGQFIIDIYKDNHSFRKEEPFKTSVFPKRGIVDGIMNLEMDLEAGIYGLGLIDDENMNGEMDFKMIRVPEEGYAFSNFYLEKLKRPEFEDFSFVLKKDQRRKVTMKMRYM